MKIIFYTFLLLCLVVGKESIKETKSTKVQKMHEKIATSNDNDPVEGGNTAEGGSNSEEGNHELDDSVVMKEIYTDKFLKSDSEEEAELILEDSYDKTGHKDLEYQETCKIKQGYLIKVDSTGTVTKNGKSVTELKGKPVFVVLNKATLSMFLNENVNSLIKTIETPKITSADPLHYGKLNCFKLMKGNDGISTFCIDEKSQMNEWVKAIKEFHDCIVESYAESEEENGNKNVKMAFKVSSPEEEDVKVVEERAIEDELSAEARIAAESGAFARKKETLIAEHVKEKEEQLKRLKQRNQLHMRQKKGIEEQLKSKEQREKQIARCNELSLETESEVEENLLKQEKESSLAREELEMIDQSLDDILEVEKQEEEREEEAEDTKIQAEENEINDIKKKIVQESISYEKQIDPTACYSKEFLEKVAAGDSAGKLTYMGKVCGIFVVPGQAVNMKFMSNCLSEDHFCDVCCENFIGKAHVTKQQTCKNKCNRVMTGQPIEPEGGFALKIPLVEEQASGKKLRQAKN